jgi:hypothetical protein
MVPFGIMWNGLHHRNASPFYMANRVGSAAPCVDIKNDHDPHSGMMLERGAGET